MKQIQIIFLAMLCYNISKAQYDTRTYVEPSNTTTKNTPPPADRKDGSTYIEPVKNEFYEKIKEGVSVFEKKAVPVRKRMYMDYTGVDVPKSIEEFKIVTNDKPVSQGITGTCWCFSTTSFYESEIQRKTKKDIQLSELYTVYNQYIEKAKEYIKTRGESLFDEGSETNEVQQMMNEYGIVPLEAYTGLLPNQVFHNHDPMMAELRSYLEDVKTHKAWNEKVIIETVKSIMNHYLGEPPNKFMYEGKEYTPQSFMAYTTLQPSEYVTFMSLKSEPYKIKTEYKVPDNWRHNKEYINIPLDDFINAIKESISNGYSVSIGGDVSEAGMNSKEGLAMVPSFDIPSSYINEDARLFRFLNGSTTDDHAMHLIGYVKKASGTWFLIKDSGSGGHNNKNAKGYWYMHEDFVKLKMMTFTVHKNAVAKYIY